MQSAGCRASHSSRPTSKTPVKGLRSCRARERPAVIVFKLRPESQGQRPYPSSENKAPAYRKTGRFHHWRQFAQRYGRHGQIIRGVEIIDGSGESKRASKPRLPCSSEDAARVQGLVSRHADAGRLLQRVLRSCSGPGWRICRAACTLSDRGSRKSPRCAAVSRRDRTERRV